MYACWPLSAIPLLVVPPNRKKLHNHVTANMDQSHLPTLPPFEPWVPFDPSLPLDSESIGALFAQLERDLQQPPPLPSGPNITELMETASGNRYSSGLTCEEVYVAAELTERRGRIRDLQRLWDHLEAQHKKAASDLRACRTRLTEERNSMAAFHEAQDQRLRLLRLKERTAARKWLRDHGMLAECAADAPPASSRKTKRTRTVRST